MYLLPSGDGIKEWQNVFPGFKKKKKSDSRGWEQLRGQDSSAHTVLEQQLQSVRDRVTPGSPRKLQEGVRIAQCAS